MLATASETGTIIRVFSVPKGQKLYQFRRGTLTSTIYSMSFNLGSTLLCVSSNSDTVHIFRLGNAAGAEGGGGGGGGGGRGTAGSGSGPSTREVRSSRSRSFDSGGDDEGSSSIPGSPRSEAEGAAGSMYGGGGNGGGNNNGTVAHRRQSGSFSSMLRRSSQIMGRSVAGVVGSYLPQSVTEMWEPQRDFASVKIPKVAAGQGGAAARGGSLISAGNPRSVVAMSSSSPQVMVVTSDGGFYVFHIDLEKGGEGYLVKQFSCVN